MKNGLKYILPFLFIVVFLFGKGATHATHTNVIDSVMIETHATGVHLLTSDADLFPSSSAPSIINVRTIHKHMRRTDNGPRRCSAMLRSGGDMSHRHSTHIQINLKLFSPHLFEAAHFLSRLGRLII